MNWSNNNLKILLKNVRSSNKVTQGVNKKNQYY